MKIRTSYLMLSLLMSMTLLFYACSEKVSSKPNFIFKAAPQTGAAFKINGKVVTEEELFKGSENDIFEAEMKVYELKMNKVRAKVLEILMESHPKKKGLSNDEFLDLHIAKDVKVQEKAIKEFITERKIPKEHVNDQMKGRIKQFLEMELKKEAVEKWIASQTAKKPVEVYLQEPQRPVYEVATEGSPFTGGADAKVTIVEFSDFQCPFCAKGAKVVDDLKKKYGNKIKVVFKNFPLPFHKDAKTAAVAGLCANEQDGSYFWKLHDKMFGSQHKLSKDGLKEMAKGLGLDAKKFNECLDGNRYLAQVEKDINQGKDVGVKSTPTFFVNGKVVNGALPIESFSELIDQDLNK